MIASILQTKLFIPPLRPGLITRGRLIDLLNQDLFSMDGSFARKLTLVTAPAGFGKTTLVTSWIHDMALSPGVAGPDLAKEKAGPDITQIAATWLTLDDSEDNFAGFLTYFIAALRRIPELQALEVGESALALLNAPPSAARLASIEASLCLLINDLAAAGSFVLVLDDSQVIEAATVHQAISFLLEHMPPQMHLVLSGRVDPPIPLAHLRAGRQLLEIHAEELRFNLDETSRLLQQEVSLAIGDEDVKALESRTEGWIVGLQLAVLSMKGSASPQNTIAFIRVFSGSHQYILDYLLAEVLQRQPPEVHSFLMETAYLNRLCGPLCDAVTGGQNSQEILEFLESANLFTIPLDHERGWYRYHSLFADLLRARSMQQKGLYWPERHRRAAGWYEENGYLGEALEHWLQAGEADEAAYLVEENALALLNQGQIVTAMSWIERLPAKLIRSRPWLAIFQAWVTLLTGQIEQVEPYLKYSEAALPAGGESAGSNDARGHIAAIRAYRFALQGDMAAAIEQTEAAQAQLSPQSQGVRSVVTFVLGGTRLMQGDLMGAERAFLDAARNGRAAGNIHVAVAAMSNVAKFQMGKGLLRRAARTFEQTMQMARTPAGRPLPIAAQTLIGLGQLQYEWDDLAAAMKLLEEGQALNQHWANADTLVSCNLAMAQIRQARWELEQATELLRQSEMIAEEHALTPMMMSNLVASGITLALARGNVPAAEKLAAKRRLQADDPLSYARQDEYLALVRLLAAAGRPEEAQMLLDRLIQSAQGDGRSGDIVRMRAVQAALLRELHETEHAVLSLTQTLYLAETEGFIRTFVDEGEPMAYLLAQVALKGILPHYVGALRNSAEAAELARTQAQASLMFAPVEMLPEPLSEREVEILGLIANGLTNQAIADELIIAKGTVKAHTSTIYRKLEVSNRTQAVARARELKII